jgi:hypothetical protein
MWQVWIRERRWHSRFGLPVDLLVVIGLPIVLDGCHSDFTILAILALPYSFPTFLLISVLGYNLIGCTLWTYWLWLRLMR